MGLPFTATATVSVVPFEIARSATVAGLGAKSEHAAAMSSAVEASRTPGPSMTDGYPTIAAARPEIVAAT